VSVDAETETFLARARVRGAPSPRDVPIAALRQATEDAATEFGLAPEAVSTVHEVEHGRLYVPVAPRGVVVYAHGGAFVRGSVDSHDGLVRAFANGACCAVLSVDYRLAPEHPFPASLDDMYAAVQSVADRGPVVVAGDSAGGNLAAACTLKTRAEGGAPIAFQALLQPVLDMRAQSPSIDALGDEYLLPRDFIEWSHDVYLDSADPDDPLASPLRASDFSGLPPGLVVTGELDPFRDEGEAYAAAAGLEHVRYPGLIHHAVQVPGAISLGERVIRETARRIGDALEEAVLPSS
jgi:acetyl esterase